MKKEHVPQDDSDVYQGQKKLLYAVDKDGHYQGVKSSGWDVETFATKLAVEELESLTKEAHEEAQQGTASPLKYHMLQARHDVLSLAQASGFFQWQVKRHLKPQVFEKLNEKKLTRYAQVFSKSIRDLKEVPEKP